MANRVVAIIGASGGIGAALARKLVAEGESLILAARRGPLVEEIASQCGPNALAVTADATRRDDLRRVISEGIDRFGHIDVWVNNVGRGIFRVPTELSGEDIDQMILVNVKSALYGMQEILPHFRERKAGHIVNVSSTLGRIPSVPFRSAYSASKHFLNALVESLKIELRETDPYIAFTLVSPGVVRTDFGDNALHGGPSSHTLPYSQSVDEAAAVIARAIRERREDVYTHAGTHDRVARYYSERGEDLTQ